MYTSLFQIGLLIVLVGFPKSVRFRCSSSASLTTSPHLTSEDSPNNTTKLSEWLEGNADGLERKYVSEPRRNWWKRA